MQGAAADRFALFFLERDLNRFVCFVAKNERVALRAFLDRPFQLPSEPAGQKKCGRPITGGKINLDFFDFSQATVGTRMIEELGERETELVKTGPVQIA